VSSIASAGGPVPQARNPSHIIAVRAYCSTALHHKLDVWTYERRSPPSSAHGDARQILRAFTSNVRHNGGNLGTMKRFALAAMAAGFTAVSLSPVPARAQLGGLVNRAKKAVQPDRPEPPSTHRNGLVTVTSARIESFAKGYAAEQTEAGRLDSLEALSQSTPQTARQSAVMRCQLEASAKYNRTTPEQQKSDSIAASGVFAGVDTARMQKLALRAQSGDPAAMAELQKATMELARRQAADPRMNAMRERMMKNAEASSSASAACDRNTPPAAAFAGPISRAKAEIAKYGTRLSQTRNAHMESVKLQAAGGISATEYAGIEERVRAYMANPDSPSGFSAAELAALNAHRTELKSLKLN
jgi:hypothetical protein